MRLLIIMCSILSAAIHPADAQNRYFTKSGKISFYSKTPLAAIEAHNAKSVSVFDLNTGQIEFSVLMKGFEFEKARMQEDFNENFVESNKYPKAVFNGKITNIRDLMLSKDGVYTAQVSGLLTIHGVSRSTNAQASFTVKSGIISASSEFTIQVADYDIKIPGLVADKIGKSARIVVHIPSYQPLNVSY